MRGAELVELPAQQLPRSRRSRVGVGTAVAILAVAALLAGGLGLLGGRPEGAPAATTPRSGVAIAATPIATSPARTPAVTPYTPCKPRLDPGALPDVLLETNGVPTAGLVEPADDGPPGETRTFPPATPASPVPPILGPRVEVRPDVITELWIVGAACAVAWSIELIDPMSGSVHVLDGVGNDAGDTGYAAQNRFNISAKMGEHRGIGHDVQLGAVLAFPDGALRAHWRLRILPLERPIPALVAGPSDVPIPVAEGCDIGLELASGWNEPATILPCSGDLSVDPGPPTRIRPGETLELRFDGWMPFATTVTCGRLDGLAFVAEPEPGCFFETPEPTFLVPADPAAWTLAISTCASQGVRVANVICGTWYANVEIVGETSRPATTSVSAARARGSSPPP